MDPTREHEIKLLVRDAALAQRVLELVHEDEQAQRELRRMQQKAGIEAARGRHVRLGRPPKPLPSFFGELYAKVQNGTLSKEEAAEAMGISVSCLRRKMRRYREELAAGGAASEQREV